MERRQFLAASIATSAAALAGNAAAQAPAPAKREFYQLRRYNLMSGPQLKLTENYLGDALIPALARMGMGPVGAFKLDIGQDTPAYYVLIPGPSVDALAELDLHLAKDEDFLKVAAPFWNSTATAPAYQRVEISLLAAFEGWPKLTPPASAAPKASASSSSAPTRAPATATTSARSRCSTPANSKSSSKPASIPSSSATRSSGSRLPHLTYMLSFENTAELEAKWDVFRSDPELEEALHRSQIRLRPDRHQHQQRDAKPPGLLANLRTGNRE